MDNSDNTIATTAGASSSESLIKELNSKLEELDHKVLLYRRDMATQFSKFVEERLKGETGDVIQQVNDAVRERLRKSSLADIPEDAITAQEGSMTPSTDRLEVTEVGGQIANQISRNMTQETREGKRPAPVLIKAPEGEDDVPRSPHARENEFLGVFTQEYLPLLDSNKQHERRVSGSTSSQGEGSVPLPIRRPQSAEKAQSQGLSLSYSPPRSGPHPNKPEHQRRHTGDAAFLSDPEGHKPRRSALRRSSSSQSSKAHSLRKVRFEFAGVEFPTTSSPNVENPLSTADAADLPLSSLSSGSTVDDDSDMAESEQVEFIEDVDDEEEVPRRISSSQALRMLSRGPIEDDGTQWEEVVAPEDGSPSVAVEQANLDSDEEDIMTFGLKSSRSDEKKSPSPTQQPSPTKEEPEEADEARETEHQEQITPEERAEEEDILADMIPLAPMHSTRSVMGNNASVTTTTTFTPFATGLLGLTAISESTATHQPLGDLAPMKSETTTNIPSSGTLGRTPKKEKAKAFILPDDSDEDDLPFEFEDGSGHSTARKEQRVSSPVEDEDESDTSSESPMSPERGVPESLSMYARSPARDIVGRDHVETISPTTINTFNNSNLPGAGSLTAAGILGEGQAQMIGNPSSSLGRVQGDSALSSWPVPGTPPMNMSGSWRERGAAHFNQMGREGGSSLRNSYHPFQIPVVDPVVNELARGWGDERSFVGSVSGCTGLDEWDGEGYKGSLRGTGSLRGQGSAMGSGNRDMPAGRGRGDSGAGSMSGVGSMGGGRPMSFTQRMEQEETVEQWERERRRGGN